MPPAATATTISITRLAARLGVNRMYLSGLVDGLGLLTLRGGQNSKAIRMRDIPAIEQAIHKSTAVKRG